MLTDWFGSPDVDMYLRISFEVGGAGRSIVVLRWYLSSGTLS